MVIAAVGQLCSTASMTHNLSQCQVLVRKAVAAGAKALFLPEASDYIASSPSETLSLARDATSSPFVRGLQHEAATHNLPINVGIHEPATSTGTGEEGEQSQQRQQRVKNTLIWIAADGSITHRYQKLHLFDVDIPHGGPVLKESNSVEPGSAITRPFESPLGRIGMLICFDLRFPTLSTRIRDLGAQILTYPSAFTVPTGQVHWETLLRARAIENQCFVLAAAQVGRHNGKRVSYGHSLIVDPWGKVLGEGSGLEGWERSGEEPEIVCADIDLEGLRKVRTEMPLKARRDVVDVVEG